MNVVVLSDWEQAVAARKITGGVALGTGLATTALMLAVTLGVEGVRWPTVVLALLTAHLITGWVAWRRIAALQARLDMKRIALDARGTPPLAVLGETIKLGSEPIELRARDGTKFTVTLNAAGKGSEQTWADLSVRYYG